MIDIKINNNLDKIINKLDKVNIEIQTAFSEIAMSKGEFIRTALNERYENLFDGADISFAPDQSGMKVNIIFAGKNYWKFVNGYKFNMQEMHGMVNTLVADIVRETLTNSLRGNPVV
jgi:hypothetical protein